MADSQGWKPGGDRNNGVEAGGGEKFFECRPGRITEAERHPLDGQWLFEEKNARQGSVFVSPWFVA